MLPENIELYRPLENFPAKCLVELEMLKMSQEIRNKLDWHEKVLDSEITAKWKEEAEKQGLSSDAADYVIDEVKLYATQRDGFVEPGPVEGTWKADKLIDDDLLSRLKNLVGGLEKNQVDKKDYHPGSDQLVVDLVHPSLYCYVEDHSILINEDSIDQQFMPKSPEAPPKKVRKYYAEATAPSSKYRWLPSEVKVADNNSISIESYINNLHPIQHKGLYGVLGEILQKFIPLFNRTLTDTINWKEPVIDLSRWSWYGDESFDFDKHGDDCDEAYATWEKNRPILPVPIPKFSAPEAPKKVVDLKGEPLQVIFKLANIELTPEKPKYGGGTWHVEGIEEERIVATGIYYFEMENITESKLSFRQSIEDPHYEQNDDRGVFAVYGMKNEDPLNQVLGSLTAELGRCIVFPNIYQHLVKPFKLVDKTKPGFRKILVFFLVDPTVKIISTHNVLPQQPDWDDVQPDEPADKRQKMTRKEAEDMREKLMFQRKYARDEFQKEFYEREFSLCEHWTSPECLKINKLFSINVKMLNFWNN